MYVSWCSFLYRSSLVIQDNLNMLKSIWIPGSRSFKLRRAPLTTKKLLDFCAACPSWGTCTQTKMPTGWVVQGLSFLWIYSQIHLHKVKALCLDPQYIVHVQTLDKIDKFQASAKNNLEWFDVLYICTNHAAWHGFSIHRLLLWRILVSFHWGVMCVGVRFTFSFISCLMLVTYFHAYILGTYSSWRSVVFTKTFNKTFAFVYTLTVFWMWLVEIFWVASMQSE